MLRTSTFILLLIFGSISLTKAQGTLQEILTTYINDGLVDYQNLKKHQDQIQQKIKSLQDQYQSEDLPIAEGVNYYNLLIIYQVLDNYPIHSVEQINGIFTKSHPLAWKNKSLNELEKWLLEKSGDPRLHFALNCGAISCPDITNKLYEEATLDSQLDERTRMALADPRNLIIDTTLKTIKLNQIFKWYRHDFKDIGLLNFINQYQEQDIDDSYGVEYLIYDWSLNDLNGFRYYATNLYERGEFEIQWFNNYYTQRETGLRADDNFGRYNFFTSFINTTYGVSNKINLTLGLRFRSVTRNLNGNDGFWEALSFRNAGNIRDINNVTTGYSRTGISAIYPGIKYNPFKNHPDISLYHAIHIPLGNALEGNDQVGFLDWKNITIQNNIYYTKDVAEDQVLFIDAGLLLENVGTFWFNNDTGFSQVGTPITVIYSFFPSNKFTYYGLVNVTPRVAINFGESNQVKMAPFGQLGGGVKYFLSSKLEAELLYTYFYDGVDNRLAQTFNLGFRYYGL